MKYIKLIMLLVVAAFVGACSNDDDSWNTASDVTVSMKNATMSFKENMGLSNVPIVVNGATNGNVFVTVEIKEIGTDPAKEDVHYYITDKTINISGMEGNVEVEPVDDDDINKDRTFEITIVDAKGAKIGEQASTIVTLRDNDSEIYERLQGTWKITGVSRQGSPLTGVVKIVGATDEDDADYDKTLYLTDMAVKGSTARLTFHYDKETQKGYVAFDNLTKYNFLEAIELDGLGTCNIKLSNLSNGQLTTTPIMGTWSEDCKEIIFEEGQMLFGGIYSTTDSFLGYEYFSVTNIKLTKTR